MTPSLARGYLKRSLKKVSPYTILYYTQNQGWLEQKSIKYLKADLLTRSLPTLSLSTENLRLFISYFLLAAGQPTESQGRCRWWLLTVCHKQQMHICTLYIYVHCTGCTSYDHTLHRCGISINSTLVYPQLQCLWLVEDARLVTEAVQPVRK